MFSVQAQGAIQGGIPKNILVGTRYNQLVSTAELHFYSSFLAHFYRIWSDGHMNFLAQAIQQFKTQRNGQCI